MTGIRLYRRWQAFFVISLLILSTPASAQSLEKVFKNSVGMEFILVPAGTFVMGSPSNEPLRNSGETQHQVTLAKPFYMQTTEVTLAQWRKLMGKGLFGFLKRRKGPDQMPVSRICFHDATDFIQKLNTMGEGQYRLPTEAEWEYAARAGTQTAYSWGDRSDCTRAMFANKKGRFDDCAWYAKQQDLPLDGPAPVKSYAPNPWGLYDMHGNVWEWCLDWYGPYKPGPQTDPKGPPKATQRVRRSGSWFGKGDRCRSANRANGHPSSRFRNTGFRVVRIAQP